MSKPQNMVTTPNIWLYLVLTYIACSQNIYEKVDPFINMLKDAIFYFTAHFDAS